MIPPLYGVFHKLSDASYFNDQLPLLRKCFPKTRVASISVSGRLAGMFASLLVKCAAASVDKVCRYAADHATGHMQPFGRNMYEHARTSVHHTAFGEAIKSNGSDISLIVKAAPPILHNNTPSIQMDGRNSHRGERVTCSHCLS
jgi:hypothetical protein